MKSQDKKERRLKLLCGNIHPPTPLYPRNISTLSITDRVKEFVEFNNNSPRITQEIELLNLFIELKFSNEVALKFWQEAWDERLKRSLLYKQKPIRVRQDNKTSINYGGGSGSWPTIRYPKKCRKTAWKRFYKLFPHLNKDKK